MSILSKKAEVLKKLYDEGKIAIAGIAKAVRDGVITTSDYKIITGQDYTE